MWSVIVGVNVGCYCRVSLYGVIVGVVISA